MGEKPAGKQKGESRARLVEERALIIKSMRRWEEMDETAKRAGRGLGRRELMDRVAQEVGTSQRHVQSALKGVRA